VTGTSNEAHNYAVFSSLAALRLKSKYSPQHPVQEQIQNNRL